MVIKTNPYSEALKQALEAVRDVQHPDYQLLPLDPSIEMLAAGSKATGLTTTQLRDAYSAMVAAWSVPDKETA